MWGDRGVVTYLIARVRALLPEDWSGRAGGRFREGIQRISDYAESRQELLQQGTELVGRKLVGLANQEFMASEKNLADAAKSFAEREDKLLDAELKRRALESDASKREADARKAHVEAELAERTIDSEVSQRNADARRANAEADLIEIKRIEALYKLQKRLASEGMMLMRDSAGDLLFAPLLPSPPLEQVSDGSD